MARRRGMVRWLAPLVFGGALTGCALIEPLPKARTVEDRLAALPTTGLPIAGRVTVYWNEQQIPFVEAERDEDAAFALGLVHAHLRLGQMAIFRRVAQGRIAEMGGPLAIDIDHGLRIIDFGRAAPASVAAMPEPTRRWLQRFVDGINHYQAQARPLPVEYGILGLDREPWTVEDVVAFGRLAGTDVNWLVWFNLLKLRERPDWPQIWARLVREGGDNPPPGTGAEESAALADLLGEVSRSGSNSLAVAPSRTRTGGAILANDPHLGINLPNTWLIAGLKSPSYHVVGLMIPGVPVFAIGRNPQIAWGGTNLRALASDLVDVSGRADELRTRSETIRVRWWFDQQVAVRDSRWGPILSDAPQLSELRLPATALRWTGHLPSDEVSAMLAVAQAQSFDQFRDALAGFSLPGQNMLYADAAGNIGKVFAVRVPDRSGPPPTDVVVPAGAEERAWTALRSAEDLPAVLNPPEGFLASANNRPRTPNTAIGYFFSPEDRVQRMAALLDDAGTVDVEQVKAFQRDVYVASSARLNEVVVRKIRETGIADQLTGASARVFELMAGWDGHYRKDSQAPVAFELFRHQFTQDFYQAIFGESDWAAFAGVGEIKTLMIEDIDASRPEVLAPSLRLSLDAAGESLDEFPTWGDMHRLELRHPLAFLPVVGSRFRFTDHPIGGSTDALMKTAHPSTDQRHRATYGANARHVSDLTDPDGNWFVILGGQDGWLNSAAFVDQVPLWLEGRYVQMPLTMETVRDRFRRVTELRS